VRDSSEKPTGPKHEARGLATNSPTRRGEDVELKQLLNREGARPNCYL
jgi:hypothetical protein